MKIIQIIRTEIERHRKKFEYEGSMPNETVWKCLGELLSFLDTLPEEPEERGNLQDAEVIFSGHALHTDVTKWADGYKLKIRIYDDD